MGGKAANEGLAIIVEKVALLRQVLGNEDDVGPRHLPLLGDIGLGHALGAVDDVARPFREPGIEAAIEGDRGEQCHHQRRHAANRLSSATIRTCSPDPASCRRRAARRPQTCTEISSAISATSTPFTARNRMTISRDGCSGVSPVRMTKVASPLSTDRSTSGRPRRVGHDALPDRSTRGGGADPGASSAPHCSAPQTCATTSPAPSCFALELSIWATNPVRPSTGRHTPRGTKLKEVLLKFNRKCGNSATLLDFFHPWPPHTVASLTRSAMICRAPLSRCSGVSQSRMITIFISGRSLARDPWAVIHWTRAGGLAKLSSRRPIRAPFGPASSSPHWRRGTELDRHDLEQVLALPPAGAEPVGKLGGKAVEITCVARSASRR